MRTRLARRARPSSQQQVQARSYSLVRYVTSRLGQGAGNKRPVSAFPPLRAEAIDARCRVWMCELSRRVCSTWVRMLGGLRLLSQRGALRLHAGEPDELAAGWTGVGHAKIADEGDEAAPSGNRAPGTDRCGLRVDRRYLQRPPRGRTRNLGRSRFTAGHGRLAIEGNVPPEQAVVKVGPSLQIWSQMVA